MTHNEITGAIIEAAIAIHRKLGPGLLESVYQAVMEYELRKRGLRVRRQVPIPVVYEEVQLDIGFRSDLIVEEAVMVELKSVEEQGKRIKIGRLRRLAGVVGARPPPG